MIMSGSGQIAPKTAHDHEMGRASGRRGRGGWRVGVGVRRMGKLYAVSVARELYPVTVVSRRMLSMPRVVQVPDIRKVDLPEARQAIPHVHAYLRECILDGTLKPGTKLSQVSLAAQLGISRTPLREVLRMLQEEGLVEIEPNQRTRVAGLDPQELDDVLREPDPAGDAGAVDDDRALRPQGARRGKGAADRDAPGGQGRRFRRVVRGAHRLSPGLHGRGRRDDAASATGLCRPDHPLHPHLPAVRAG